MAEGLGVEIKDFFEFTHEAKDKKELKSILRNLAKGVDEERFKMMVKVVRTIVR